MIQHTLVAKMSSRGAGGRASTAGRSNNASSRGKNATEVSSPKVEQLGQGVVDISLDDAQDDGEWEIISRKSKNRAGSSAAKPWGFQNSNPKAWGHPDVINKQGMRNNFGSGRMSANAWSTQVLDSKRLTNRGNTGPQSSNRGSENNYVAPQSVIPPPLEHGWNWQSRVAATAPNISEDGEKKYEDTEVNKESDVDCEDDEEEDAMDDTDDELLSEDFDSDASQKSHDTRKNSRWFKKFFESLDNLTVEEINEPARQWHCPACQGGPGAIDWYKACSP
ncbi:hypothetical protein GH714_010216 [Hevea brasiliensis]|uniref:Zinc finger-XS domain-containing protein n=1 Tax=Hevea brasiliensis TaxID=3981 RepID=A0A6A6MMT5_HEVBR|nr:hypothetical protein GH714_010216 [Hevea brasiliensis]